MPLRASKMKGFILGFQRFVWCPKWTPESNNSLMPILITIFLWLKVRSLADLGQRWRNRTIPRNTGLTLVLLWPPAPTRCRMFKTVNLSMPSGVPVASERTRNIPESEASANAIFVLFGAHLMNNPFLNHDENWLETETRPRF